jgi:hypothetical protein
MSTVLIVYRSYNRHLYQSFERGRGERGMHNSVCVDVGASTKVSLRPVGLHDKRWKIEKKCFGVKGIF